MSQTGDPLPGAGPKSVRHARLMIVDDHPAVRDGLSARLAGCIDLELCGEADGCDTALAGAAALRPDIVVVDILLKQGDGLMLVKQLREAYPTLGILVWSMYDDQVYAQRAWRAGANGYLNKRFATEAVIDALRAVADGRSWFPDTVHTTGTLSEDPIGRLSDRELEVFRWIGAGQTTAQIAERLNVSVKTVETHRQRIKIKLRLKNSIELNRRAVHWTIENG